MTVTHGYSKTEGATFKPMGEFMDLNGWFPVKVCVHKLKVRWKAHKQLDGSGVYH